MSNGSMTAKLLLRLVLVSGLLAIPGLWAQDSQTAANPALLAADNRDALVQSDLAPAPDAYRFHIFLMPQVSQSYSVPRPVNPSFGIDRTNWTATPGTIERMESAFYCNDTPFVDQVRLPLATFWNGRVKLTGFESDVTTANFVLGLPGQGSLHNLSAFGNAFLATHTPPSDQLGGINVVFSLRPQGFDASENSGRHGIEYLMRASRGILPFFSARSDSISMPAR